MGINTVWLTVNRNCNLSCEWCYAKEASQNSVMDIDLAKDLINIAKQSGAKKFLLIGGEPTIYPFLFEVLEYLINAHTEIVIVTNGLMLQDYNFCSSIRELNYENIHFGISLKGSSEKEYIDNCGSKGYLNVLDGIHYCEEFGFQYSLSYVLSLENIYEIINFANQIRKSGINKPIFFEICNAPLVKNTKKACDNRKVLLEIDTEFSHVYDELAEVLDNKLLLHQMFPLCLCNKNTLDKMQMKNQLITSCHVHSRCGLIFDVDGSILLCNHFVGYSFGKYKKDYWDFDSFEKYWNSEYVVSLHKKFTTMPSDNCVNCNEADKCGGGCCFQWFSENFSKYQEYNLQKNLRRNQ